MPYELRSDRPWAPTKPVDLARDLFIVSDNLEGDLQEADRMPGVRYAGTEN